MRVLAARPPAPPDAVCALVNLAKPAGPTSRQAAGALGRLFGQRRYGHAGTLDPAAEGVLPVALGEATRFLPYLDLDRKVYRARARLGVRTATGDARGAVVEEAAVPSDIADRLARACPAFRGTILQTPPMHAALRHEGRRLYEWARRGVIVDRAPRPVRVEALDLEAATGETFTLRVVCGPGTYIRTLVEDLARAAGTVAHVESLVRLAVGPFALERAAGLDALVAAPSGERARVLLPVAAALPPGPDVALEEAELTALAQGRALDVAEVLPDAAGPVRLHDGQGGFRGLGRVAGGRLTVLRLRPVPPAGDCPTPVS